MLFSETGLPKKLCEYLEEICSNEELKDAFYCSDIEILEPESIEELMEDESLWLEPGEANYEMKPFAISADGGTWVVLNDKYIGHIDSEGGCGIVARTVDEFMNMVAVCKILFFRVQDLKDEQGFRKYLAESLKEFENPAVYDRFIEKHSFESDISKVYEIAKLGHTVKPFFVIKAIDDDYCDSHSLFGLEDQEDLENLIKVFMD